VAYALPESCLFGNSVGSPVGGPLAAWPRASACWALEGLITAVGAPGTRSVRCPARSAVVAGRTRHTRVRRECASPARTAVTRDALTPGVTAAAGRGMVQAA